LPTGDQEYDDVRREVNLHTYRLDKHGEKINDHETRLRVVEDRRRTIDVLEERLGNLTREVLEGFDAQGDEIKHLRRAVIAAAISVALSALILALTLVLQ